MAYFRENETDETRRQPAIPSGRNAGDRGNEYIQSDYDDGFDDLAGEEDDEAGEEELSEEERKEIRRKRFMLASGAGNLTAVIAGTVVILALLALLMSMIGFVLNDADRNFTLFQNRL